MSIMQNVPSLYPSGDLSGTPVVRKGDALRKMQHQRAQEKIAGLCS